MASDPAHDRGAGPLPSRLVLLCIRTAGVNAPWQARAVLPDARMLDFSSPFGLARVLFKEAAAIAPEAAAYGGGLR